ncbi:MULTISPECIES: hypothetical protein [unclassified Bacteroides]|uniref:hypothetical protein n=1 Tax=Bacteroides TaxID=816 RepID=UPI001FB20963|nr:MULTISPECIES: hypothetical protein [unclassified Bacteroides]
MPLLTVTDENPAGLPTAPMVKAVSSSSPHITRTVEVRVTDERIFPVSSAGNTYSPKDWVMVYPSFWT